MCNRAALKYTPSMKCEVKERYRKKNKKSLIQTNCCTFERCTTTCAYCGKNSKTTTIRTTLAHTCKVAVGQNSVVQHLSSLQWGEGPRKDSRDPVRGHQSGHIIVVIGVVVRASGRGNACDNDKNRKCGG